MDTVKFVQGILPVSGNTGAGMSNIWRWGSHVEGYPDKPLAKCAIFPENNFAHSIMTVSLYTCAFPFFGLKSHISKIDLSFFPDQEFEISGWG